MQTMQTQRFTIFQLIVLFTIICLVGCKEKESHEPIVMMAAGLDTLRDNWIKQGRKDGFDPSNAVRSSVERYYAYTNTVTLDGKVYQCRFAARSQLLHSLGAMAITDEGVLLWIYDNGGKVIASPQKNGIERIDQK